MDIGISKRLAKLYEEGKRSGALYGGGEAGRLPKHGILDARLSQEDEGISRSAAVSLSTASSKKPSNFSAKERAGADAAQTLSATEAALDGAACGKVPWEYTLEKSSGESANSSSSGAGHVGKAIAHLRGHDRICPSPSGMKSGVRQRGEHPWGRTVCCPLENFFDHVAPFHGDTYVIIVTRGTLSLTRTS